MTMKCKPLTAIHNGGGIVPLPKVIHKQGFILTQIWRKGNIAIYEQMKPGWSKPGYEVILIQVQKGHYLGKDKDNLVEHYPGNSEWGRFGFTHRNELDALKAANSAYREELLKGEGECAA